MGIQLLFTNPLVVSQEEFNSSALARLNRAGMDVAQRGGEVNRLVLLMLGRDDLLLSAYLNWSAGPSGTYMSTWRNGESLRVRINSLESGSISRISVAEETCRYGGMEVSGWPTRSHS